MDLQEAIYYFKEYFSEKFSAPRIKNAKINIQITEENNQTICRMYENYMNTPLLEFIVAEGLNTTLLGLMLTIIDNPDYHEINYSDVDPINGRILIFFEKLEKENYSGLYYDSIDFYIETTPENTLDLTYLLLLLCNLTEMDFYSETNSYVDEMADVIIPQPEDLNIELLEVYFPNNNEKANMHMISLYPQLFKAFQTADLEIEEPIYPSNIIEFPINRRM